MNASDIEAFFVTNIRADNDRTNSLRESALALIGDDTHLFFNDPTYGEKWHKVRAAFMKFVKDHLNIEGFTRFSLNRRGGLGNHHDFDFIIYNAEGESMYPVMTLEFKNNSMPQFMQEFDKNLWTDTQLAEFWYDSGFLDKIIAIYPQPLPFPKPPRDEYLNGVHKMMTKKFPPSFFKQFYEFDHNESFKEQTKKKDKVTKEGIKTFLAQHGSTFKVSKLREKCQAEQTNKIYFIWKTSKKLFEYHKITSAELSPSVICGVTASTVILKSGPSYLECRLRWKNSLGICCPAWQISIKKNLSAAVKKVMKIL